MFKVLWCILWLPWLICSFKTLCGFLRLWVFLGLSVSYSVYLCLSRPICVSLSQSVSFLAYVYFSAYLCYPEPIMCLPQHVCVLLSLYVSSLESLFLPQTISVFLSLCMPSSDNLCIHGTTLVFLSLSVSSLTYLLFPQPLGAFFPFLYLPQPSMHAFRCSLGVGGINKNPLLCLSFQAILILPTLRLRFNSDWLMVRLKDRDEAQAYKHIQNTVNNRLNNWSIHTTLP